MIAPTATNKARKMKFTQGIEQVKSPLKLTGPAGGKVAKSQFMLVPERGLWQWAAWEETGELHMIVEVAFDKVRMPWIDCDNRTGALWKIREIAGHYTAK